MKAVVLVGGEGTRLRPLTYTTPKQLLPIVEMPMLERVLGHLASHGIDEAVLSLGYRPEAFMLAYPDQIVAGVSVSYAVEPQRMDTAGAIRFAALHAGIDETFIVLNGDVLTDGDVSALIDFHTRTGATTTIYLSPVEDPSRFGVVPTDDDGRVIEFVEKPAPGTAPTNLINAGIYVMEPEVLDRIPDGRPVSVEERETFPSLASDGMLFAMTDSSYWLDTGTPEAYLQAQSDLLEGRRKFPPAPGAVRAGAARYAGVGAGQDACTGAWTLGSPVIEGSADKDSLVGDGARIHSGASVVGSVVGAGCVVEGGAKVSRSVLLAGASVLRGALVDLSIIGPRSVIGAACSVSELSIVGDDVVLEDGSQLANGRLPEHPSNLN